MSATGKAKQLSEKHEWTLRMGTLPRSNDVGCQTVDSLLGVSRHQSTPEPESEQNLAHSRLDDEHKQNWLEQNHENTGGTLDISGVGLGKYIIQCSHFCWKPHSNNSGIRYHRFVQHP